MSENSKIEWCDHTFNPWIGCTKVSPGCANCYAEAWDARFHGHPISGNPIHWGKGAPRQRTSKANWKKVERWNRLVRFDRFCTCGRFYKGTTPNLLHGKCYSCGERWESMRRLPNRVFVASLADWLDPEVPIEWLADLLDLVRRCPHLDFLMLTKRPELWEQRIAEACAFSAFSSPHHELMQMLVEWHPQNAECQPPTNVYIGTSVEDQIRANERIPALLKIPARVRFLSCEPLLGPVDLGQAYDNPFGAMERGKIHWVIAGGESGPNARPMHPDWARSLRDQCQDAGVAFFFKQWGEWCPQDQAVELTEKGAASALYLDENGKTESAAFGARRYRATIQKLGKAKAGRLLDGRPWSEFPKGGAR